MKTKTAKRTSPRIGISGALVFALLAFFHPIRRGAANPQAAALVSRSIEGAVVDHAGNTVPGAVVLIKDLKTLQVRSFIVQKDGKYRFHGLSPDANYQLQARFEGVSSRSKTVSVFESKPTVVVNLKFAAKAKRQTEPVR